ncbi:HesA/MoeB/ThiF family protein [Arenibacter certesii]|uniref:Molybdopterin-synthase adenylyltransferase n=1 Tax=Arenibacter certesii TaxID=228955 RepID=A0A918J356_9FLAO|nr:HesA/MoeB/ThiF family protein [Arenibacter certesii]GGW44256.1 molybdopterin biosynthesis protein MoeB [Arenibacter certesii]
MEFNRYQRQTNLNDFGPEAQQKLKDARILVIGAGGLGTPALSYLNAMGVGTLGIIEQDIIELTNLQRQVLYTEADLGNSKLKTLVAHLKSQNSATHFITYETFLNKDNALEIISQFDLVVDGSDNFSTRYLVNDACVILNKPFVSGAIQGFEGQLSVYNYKGGPTYRCLFPNMPLANEIPNCNVNGVLGVIPGIIGSLQALEAVKVVAQIGEVMSGKLVLFNGLLHRYQIMRFSANPGNTIIKELKESYGSENCYPITTINSGEFLKIWKSEDTLQVIDVRTEEEFKNDPCTKSKAINIPLNQLMEFNLDMDINKPIYLICQSGQRSSTGVKILQDKFEGFSFVNVAGGLNKLLILQK